jgi:hypothetical protein
MGLRRIIGIGLALLLVAAMSLPGMCSACTRRERTAGCEEGHAPGAQEDYGRAGITSGMNSMDRAVAVDRQCEDCAAKNEGSVSYKGSQHSTQEFADRLAVCDQSSCSDGGERALTAQRSEVLRDGDLQTSQVVFISTTDNSHAVRNGQLAGYRFSSSASVKFVAPVSLLLSISLKI